MHIHVTHNFKRNLDGIQEFLRECDAGESFQLLLTDLFDQVFPRLRQYPEMGVNFFQRTEGSHEVLARVNQLRKRLKNGMQLRELIHADFLILYAFRAPELYLLSIKHHRQLSFDLSGHWL